MAYLDNLTYVLNIQPGSVPVPVHLSQNENGRKLYFTISGNESAFPSGTSVTISGTKPDGVVYSASGSLTNGVVLINEDTQMTAIAGTWDAKIKLISSGQTVATGRVKFIIDEDTVAPGSVPSDSQLEGLVAEAQYYAEEAREESFGSPLVASTAAGMTDHNRVYVYTGSESGYTAGHWYYWNGSAWADGGIYNSVAVNTDDTLSLVGVAADAKAVGDALEKIRVAPRLASTDLNTMQTSGLHGLHSSQTYQNAPPVGSGAVGYLEIIEETSSGNLSAVYQFATYFKGDGDVEKWARRYSVWSQAWFDWELVNSYTDTTLTEEGVPADSKAVGDEIASVREEISEIDALSDEVKEALLACFEYVGWSSNNGDELRENLYNALYGGGGMAIGTFTYLKNQVKALVGSINSTTVSDVIELRVKTDQTNRLVIGMTDGDHKLKNMSGSAVDLYLIPVPSGANFVKVTTEGGYEGNPVDFYVCSMAYNSTVNDYEKVLWSSQSASGTKIDITDKAGDGIIVGVRLNTEVYPNPLDPNVISAKIEFFAS